MLVALLASSCGGDSDPVSSDSSPTNIASESDAAQQDNDTTDQDDDATQQDDDADPTSANLHPLLEGFPLPPGSEVPYPASEYDDPRETVAQFVSVPLTHLEVAEYLFEELPDSGFTVVEGTGFATSVEGIDPDFGGSIAFENPDGVPGQVTLQVQGEKTGLNFNVFRAEM